MLAKADVVIIGCGIIGTSIGYYLTKKGKKVVILERNDLASGSTGACDQFIIMQSKIPGIHLEIAMESASLYNELAMELDYDIEYKVSGGMIVIENEKELQIMKERVKKQRAGGLDVEIFDIKEAQKKQSQLSDNLVGATYCAVDAHVSPIKVTEAFAKRIMNNGGEIYYHTEVIGVIVENNVVKGVNTNRGDVMGEFVVNAAGVYAPYIGEMVGVNIPIEPKRGQLIVTEAIPEFVSQITLSTKYLAAKHNPEVLEDISSDAKELGVGLAMEQTQKGNLLFGATREYVGFDTRVTRKGIMEIIRNAVNIYPKLKELNIIRSFGGLRPATIDGLPILGATKDPEGFIVAAGHEGDGVCLAPITGKLISQYICGDNLTFNLEQFDIDRF